VVTTPHVDSSALSVLVGLLVLMGRAASSNALLSGASGASRDQDCQHSEAGASRIGGALAPDGCDFFNKAVQVGKLINLLVSKPELTGYRIE
jgi:hypothetical protein